MKHREQPGLRRSLVEDLSSANTGTELDVKLLETLHDEELAERYLAEIRGADLSHDARRRLEFAILVYSSGFRAAMQDRGADALVDVLESAPAEFRGFAYEGATSGLSFLDYKSPIESSRLIPFLKGPCRPYSILGHIGVGAGPVLLRRYASLMEELDPHFRWFALDGHGFREGYIYRQRTLANQAVPVRLTGYARRAFDQGLGRGMWFVYAGEVERVAHAIAQFPVERQTDQWRGVGFVSTYTGACARGGLEKLPPAGTAPRLALAQGAAFAAYERQTGKNVTEPTERVCRALCGASSAEVAQIVAETREGLPPENPEEPAYVVWGRRVLERLRGTLQNNQPHHRME